MVLVNLVVSSRGVVLLIMWEMVSMMFVVMLVMEVGRIILMIVSYLGMLSV